MYESLTEYIKSSFQAFFHENEFRIVEENSPIGYRSEKLLSCQNEVYEINFDMEYPDGLQLQIKKYDAVWHSTLHKEVRICYEQKKSLQSKNDLNSIVKIELDCYLEKLKQQNWKIE
ncbi:MAG: hypothetical protein AAF990_19590 [Bacteroidota bacterium]